MARTALATSQRPGTTRALPAIFISYRRQDSEGWANFLHEQLIRVFGPDSAFLDTQSLPPGPWPQQLMAAVSGCRVVVAVIGSAWATGSDANGSSLLHDPNDWIRQELDTAFRQGKLVVPVLVDGEQMATLRSHLLPDELLPILRCQAIQLTSSDRSSAVQRLVRDLSGLGIHANYPVDSGLQDHLQRRRELREDRTSFKRYLLEEQLPFVAPPMSTLQHPARILEELDTKPAEFGGTALVGAGGVGKTRTAFEVAERAHADGWHVVHVFPGRLPIESLDLSLSTHHQRVLLVFDYIDQMPELDLVGLRELAQRRATAGIALRYLATARPLWASGANAARDALFRTLHLDPDQATAQPLIDSVVARAAPTAERHLGNDAIRDLVGSRPTIALLIALELERRAQRGILSHAILKGVRSGDLGVWLERRLNEDKLLPRQTPDLWQNEPLPPQLLVAVAALTFAPLAPERMLCALHRVAKFGAGCASGMPDHVVTVLQDLGWLEQERDSYEVAHDVVADELLERVALDSTFPRTSVLNALFAGTNGDSKILGRLAIAVRRATFTSRGTHAAQMQDAWDQVWRRHTTAIERSFRMSSVNDGAYALGAILAGLPWHESVLATWHETVSAWLAENTDQPQLRHALYRSLRFIPTGPAANEVIAAAFNWLEHFRSHVSAYFILGQLVRRRELCSEHANLVVNYACEWLDEHCDVPAASYVLLPLLRNRPQTPADMLERLVLRWLKRHATLAQAAPLLHAALSHHRAASTHGEEALLPTLDVSTEFEGEVITDVVLERAPRDDECDGAEPVLETNVLNVPQLVKLATRWLTQHSLTVEAGALLCSLLQHRELGAYLSQIAGQAIGWVQTHPESAAVPVILVALLKRDDINDQLSSIGATALAWLTRAPEHVKTMQTWRALVNRGDLAEYHEVVLPQALNWIRRLDDLEVDSMLRAMLEQPNLGHHLRAVLTVSLDWLDQNQYGRTTDARFVLRLLLGRADLGDVSAPAMDIAQRWLSEFGASEHAAFVLGPLLTNDVFAKQREATTRTALAWLVDHSKSDVAAFVLRPLLNVRTREPQRELHRVALIWVRENAHVRAADFVFKKLLSVNAGLSDTDGDQALLAAAHWLDRHWGSGDASHLLSPLLRHPRQRAGFAEALIRRLLALPWTSGLAWSLDGAVRCRARIPFELWFQAADQLRSLMHEKRTGDYSMMNFRKALRSGLQLRSMPERLIWVGKTEHWLTTHPTIEPRLCEVLRSEMLFPEA